MLCAIYVQNLSLILPYDFITVEVGGGSAYNWMAPSLQSQDYSFTMGSASPSQTASESQQSSLLFSLAKMKPPKRPLRTVGENFGKGKLKPSDDTASAG